MPEGVLRKAEGESLGESDCITDDSGGQSNCSQFAANASKRLDLTAQPTVPHAFNTVSDVRSERRLDDRRVDTDGRPFEPIVKPASQFVSTLDAESIALSGIAVDGVFGSDEDMLFADSITGSLSRSC
jgi:hypothetical protein